MSCKYSFIILLLIPKIFLGALTSEAVDLTLTKWTTETFLNEGFPFIQDSVYHLFSNVTFVPEYTNVQNDLQDQGNIYVTFEKEQNVTFHFYGAYFPKHPNYRINISTYTIEKCKDASNCELLHPCTKGTIIIDQTAAPIEKTIYISWKTQNTTTQLFVQYEHHVLKCHFPKSDEIEMRKFVIRGTEDQQISVYQENFKHTSKETSQTIIEDIDLTNKKLLFQISQCWGCSTLLQLNCNNNHNDHVTITNENSTKLVFEDNTFIYSWSQGYLKGDESSDRCQVNLTTVDTQSNKAVKKFWRIFPRAILEEYKVEMNEGSMAMALRLLSPLIIVVLVLYYF